MSLRHILIAALTGIAGAAAAAQSTDTPALLPGESVIRIEAKGSVERMPTSLTIGLNIQSDGRTPAEATGTNTRKLAKLMDDLSSLGIPHGSTALEELAAQPIYPEVEGRNDRSLIIGYRARQEIEIEVKDLSRLQSILSRLVQDGYGDVRASFEVDDWESARLDAQRNAIAMAKEEAESLARSLGKRVGRVLLVANSKPGYRGWGDEMITVSGSLVRPPLTLKPKAVTIEADVYVDWSLIDR